LTERVRVNEGREQLYGTQFAGFKDEAGEPWPIEDPRALDQRREAAGLEPFSGYVVRWNKPRDDGC
jgi:hypothetical protein